MPSKKQTKTGKSTGGKKGKSSPKAEVSPKKRPSTLVLVAWGLALSLLGALLYFSHGSRRLPAPPLNKEARSGKKQEAGRKPSPPLARSEGAPVKHKELSRREAGTKKLEAGSEKREAGRKLSPPLSQIQKPPVGHEAASDKSPLSRHQVSPPLTVSPAPRPPTQPLPAISPGHSRPRLAIVIDDFGPNIAIARQFASLPFPITMSVLPFLAHSDSIAKLVHQKGK
ncbi:MAG: divergent polysaccharide deacetylase family protein, partial [Syntrophobacteraceae bacterium]